MYQQQISEISAKELSYISDSMKNEEILTKLCVQGAVQSQNPQLKQIFVQLSQEKLNNFEVLFRTLQQQPAQYNPTYVI